MAASTSERIVLADSAQCRTSGQQPAVGEQPLVPAGPGLLRCALHGVFRQHGRHLAYCRHCQDDKTHQRSPEAAADHAAAIQADALAYAGLVGRYSAASFESFESSTDAQRSVLTACREYAATADHRTPHGLMLLGPVGTGKTHLLAAMARHMRLERAVWTRVTTPRAIVRDLRSTWARGAERTEAAVLGELVEQVDVLMLDEAGVGFGSDSELLQLFEVIDGRYARGRPTVVASNLAVPELKVALGDRIFDRVREGAKALVMSWPSYRGRV